MELYNLPINQNNRGDYNHMITTSTIVVIFAVVFCMLVGMIVFDAVIFNVSQTVAVACGIAAVIITCILCGWGYIILHLFGVV